MLFWQSTHSSGNLIKASLKILQSTSKNNLLLYWCYLELLDEPFSLGGLCHNEYLMFASLQLAKDWNILRPGRQKINHLLVGLLLGRKEFRAESEKQISWSSPSQKWCFILNERTSNFVAAVQFNCVIFFISCHYCNSSILLSFPR